VRTGRAKQDAFQTAAVEALEATLDALKQDHYSAVGPAMLLVIRQHMANREALPVDVDRPPVRHRVVGCGCRVILMGCGKYWMELAPLEVRPCGGLLTLKTP
jgi:hypothetical protein